MAQQETEIDPETYRLMFIFKQICKYDLITIEYLTYTILPIMTMDNNCHVSVLRTNHSKIGKDLLDNVLLFASKNESLTDIYFTTFSVGERFYSKAVTDIMKIRPNDILVASHRCIQFRHGAQTITIDHPNKNESTRGLSSNLFIFLVFDSDETRWCTNSEKGCFCCW